MESVSPSNSSNSSKGSSGTHTSFAFSAPFAFSASLAAFALFSSFFHSAHLFFITFFFLSIDRTFSTINSSLTLSTLESESALGPQTSSALNSTSAVRWAFS